MQSFAGAKGAASSVDQRSEKDVSTEASGSTYGELKASSCDAPPDVQREDSPVENPLEGLEQEGLDGRRKAIIVLALCVSLLLPSFLFLDWRVGPS